MFPNSSDGFLIVSNNSTISMPIPGTTHSYNIDFEKPKFFVNNHFLSPLMKCYNVKLPNPISFKIGDKFRIKIKLPKHILGNTFGYELEDFDLVDLIISLRLKSANSCMDIILDEPLNAVDYCGWLIVTIEYVAEYEIFNLCEIAYNICFDPFKLKVLYGIGDDEEQETIRFDTDICLELEKC